MSFNFKKSIPVFLSALFLTGNLLAAQPNDSFSSESNNCSPCNVVICNPGFCYAAHFSALFLQPNASNTHYVAEADGFTNAGAPIEDIVSPNWFIYDINTDYSFGFDVGVQWSPCNSSTYLSLNWTRFYSSDSSSHSVPQHFMVGPFFSIGPDAIRYKNSTGKVNYEFDLVNLNGGLSVNFGRSLHTNLFCGVSFLRLEQTLSSRYFSPTNSVSREIKSPAKFIGAGPQFGLDFQFDFLRCFYLQGLLDASLFSGSFTNSTAYTSISPLLNLGNLIPPNTQTNSVDDRSGFVPAFSAKLGLGFSTSFWCCSQLKLEAGWLSQVYLNAIQSVDMASEVIDIDPDFITLGVYARTFKRSLSNFSLSGPYVTLDVSF